MVAHRELTHSYDQAVAADSFVRLVDNHPYVANYLDVIAQQVDQLYHVSESSFAQQKEYQEIDIPLQGALLRLDLKGFSTLFEKYTTIDSQDPVPKELFELNFLIDAIRANPEILSIMQLSKHHIEKVTIEEQKKFIDRISHILAIPHEDAQQHMGKCLSIEGDALVFHFDSLEQAVKSAQSIQLTFEDTSDRDKNELLEVDTQTRIGARVGIMELTDTYQAGIKFNSTLPFPILYGNAFGRLAEVEQAADAKELGGIAILHEKNGSEYVAKPTTRTDDEQSPLTMSEVLQLSDTTKRNIETFFQPLQVEKPHDHNVNAVVTYLSIVIPTEDIGELSSKITELQKKYGCRFLKSGTSDPDKKNSGNKITFLAYHDGTIDDESTSLTIVNPLMATLRTLQELQQTFYNSPMHAGVAEGDVLVTKNKLNQVENYGFLVNIVARLAQQKKGILTPLSVDTQNESSKSKIKKAEEADSIKGNEQHLEKFKGLDGNLVVKEVNLNQTFDLQKEVIAPHPQTRIQTIPSVAYSEIYTLTHHENEETVQRLDVLRIFSALTADGRIPLTTEKVNYILQGFYGTDFEINPEENDFFLEPLANGKDTHEYVFSPIAAKILTNFDQHHLPDYIDPQIFQLNESSIAKIIYNIKIGNQEAVQTDIEKHITKAYADGKNHEVLFFSEFLNEDNPVKNYFSGLAHKKYVQYDRSQTNLEKCIRGIEEQERYSFDWKDKDERFVYKYRSKIELLYMDSGKNKDMVGDNIHELKTLKNDIENDGYLSEVTRADLLYHLHLSLVRISKIHHELSIDVTESKQYFEDINTSFDPFEESSDPDFAERKMIQVLSALRAGVPNVKKVWEYLLHNDKLGLGIFDQQLTEQIRNQNYQMLENYIPALAQFTEQQKNQQTIDSRLIEILQLAISNHIFDMQDMINQINDEEQTAELLMKTHSLSVVEAALIHLSQNVEQIGYTLKNVADTDINFLVSLRKHPEKRQLYPQLDQIEEEKMLERTITYLEEVKDVYFKFLPNPSIEAIATIKNLILAKILKGESFLYISPYLTLLRKFYWNEFALQSEEKQNESREKMEKFNQEVRDLIHLASPNITLPHI